VRTDRSHESPGALGGLRCVSRARVRNVSIARAERLVNLVLCLLSTRQYLTAEHIRTLVAGYSDAPTQEAFFRMFERDKAELRELGVPLEVGRNWTFDTVDGYRIARRDYELGDIDLEPDEAAAVALAVRLWDSPELTGAATGALLKLRAAGVDVDQGVPAVVEPKVRTTEPAFGPLLAAVQAGQAVRFDYRRPNPAELRRRATVVDEQTIDGVTGDVVELEVWVTDSAASWIAGYGEDAVVLEPEVLRKSVHERLLAVVGGPEGKL
jgi:predicted DNA-binding transcriptional regulator YafY